MAAALCRPDGESFYEAYHSAIRGEYLVSKLKCKLKDASLSYRTWKLNESTMRALPFYRVLIEPQAWFTLTLGRY
jgi:hypothetical protein